MDRDELGGLSREELVVREAAIERRDEKIRELEAELAQFRRPAKTPENSSVPPSRGQKANRAERRGRKPGPKRGHVGASRVRSEPDVVVECRPHACEGCGEPMPETGGRRVGRSQVTELPSFAPVVIEGSQYAMTCAHCGIQTVGAYPAGLEPRRTFGPGVEALLSYLHERHHVGYERLVELCRDVFGLAISQGGVENALRRLVERARPTYAVGTAPSRPHAYGDGPLPDRLDSLVRRWRFRGHSTRRRSDASQGADPLRARSARSDRRAGVLPRLRPQGG